MLECIVILAGAFLLDMALGDPVYRLHPVRLLGHAITGLERFLFRTGQNGFIGGAILFAGAISCGIACVMAAKLLWRAFPASGILAFPFLVYSCIGFMDLFRHALPVEGALNDGDTPKARSRLSRMVGRDVSVLDREGITRATVESVAENFVDGFLSILFWFGAGALAAFAAGLPPAPVAAGCAILFRTVNTLDAMVGYRSERYRHFGTVSARVDDILNFMPARLSIPVIAAAAALCRTGARRCIHTGLRDRLVHASPNAGHPESCVAGALGIRLGGPVRYPQRMLDKPWMGDDINPITPSHIHQACRLMFCAGWIAFLPVVFIFSRLL